MGTGTAAGCGTADPAGRVRFRLGFFVFPVAELATRTGGGATMTSAALLAGMPEASPGALALSVTLIGRTLPVHTATVTSCFEIASVQLS